MAKRRRKSISREPADVAPPVVEAVVARKVVAAEIDRPATGHRVAAAVSARQVTALREVVAETVRRATALQVTVLRVTVLRVTVLRVVVEVSARLVVREATDRPAEVLAARKPQNSIRRLVI